MEMNQYMIDAWNEVVKPEDTVYHLGDIAFKANPNNVCKILDSLNGTKHLIIGNHDKERDLKKYKDHLETIKIYDEISYELNGKQYNFVLFHYPISSFNGAFRKTILIHGHVHNNTDYRYESDFFIKNVSVEMINYRPISIEDIIKEFFPHNFN
jgi:calcineurin-like phosphoesterase family protein